MGLWSVQHGDCVGVLEALPDDCVDVVLTDPPYGLGADADIEAVLAAWCARQPYNAPGGGYQQRAWDAFVPGPEKWREVLRVSKPGALLLAAASVRTDDLLGVALRLAGWRIRDKFGWCYATGQVVSAGLPDGGGTGVKRSWEPWILAQKPTDGTAEESNRRWGTGSLRVYSGENSPEGTTYHPANLIVDDSTWMRPTNPPRVFFNVKTSPRERDFGLDAWPWIDSTEFTGRATGSAGILNSRAGAGRSNQRKNPHSTVKPLRLLEHFVGLMSKPGQLVLDPFCGSGTTGMVSVGAGRSFLGCDLDETSVRASRDRVAASERLYEL